MVLPLYASYYFDDPAGATAPQTATCRPGIVIAALMNYAFPLPYEDVSPRRLRADASNALIYPIAQLSLLDELLATVSVNDMLKLQKKSERYHCPRLFVKRNRSMYG